LILDGSPRTLPTRADEAGGTAVKFYKLRDNLCASSHLCKCTVSPLSALDASLPAMEQHMTAGHFARRASHRALKK